MSTLILVVFACALFILILVYLPFFTVFSIVAILIHACGASSPWSAVIMTVGLILDLLRFASGQGWSGPDTRKYRGNEYDYDDPS